MIFISHRANLQGQNIELENNPIQIQKCIDLGFDVEIDVWYINNKFMLGHDFPKYEVNFKYLQNNKLWCHAKNYDALKNMINNYKINCFWHQNDDYTVTSRGFMWCYPGIKLVDNSIAVMPETTNYSFQELKRCYAICTDNPIYYKEKFNENISNWS